MGIIPRNLVSSITVLLSAASLSACRAHETEQLQAYVEAGMNKYLRYETADKQKTLAYVGKKHAAASAGSDLKQYGGFAFKNNDTDQERVFVIGKRDNYYMAETSMFANRYKGAFVAFGVEKERDLSPFISFHVEF